MGGEKDTADEARNPDRPSSMPLVTVPDQNDAVERRHAQRPSSPELWELKQMAAANVIDISEMPGFDEETGLLPNDDDSGMCGYQLYASQNKIYICSYLTNMSNLHKNLKL